MAKLEQLIAEVSDERVRSEIAAEVKRLKSQINFGLVFEEHLPETVRLSTYPIRPGELVGERRKPGDDIWRVESVSGKSARCGPVDETDEKKSRDFALDELVVVKRFGDAIYPALTPVDRIENGGPEKPWHTLINADNFHALQLLLYSCEGQVDLIYLDPPYNSGARDWKYNNDYVDRADTWRHSKWLAMMQRRLELAKRLLRPDGVLVVAIDENEVHHLGMLLKKLFREYLHHMVTTVINPKGTGKLNFARMDEYLMFCVPDNGQTLISGARLQQGKVEDVTEEEDEEEEDKERAEETAEEDEGPWTHPFPREEADLWEKRHARRRGAESSYRHQRPNQFYPIFVDDTAGKVVYAGDALLPVEADPSFRRKKGLMPVWPIDEEGNHRCWRLVPKTMNELIDEGRVVLGRRTKKSWTLNMWYRKTTDKKVKTVWWNTHHDAGTHGTTLLHKILGRRDAFPFPKSIHAVRDTIATVCGNRPNALILDFFAGSGTTYHATCMLNAEDGGCRRSISVTYNEVAERRARALQREGIFPGDDGFESEGICEAVTWPRSKAVTEGIRPDGEPVPGAHPKNGPLEGRTHAEGFSENLEYFRLDFLDPSSVAMGEQFEAILPILWMRSGAQGKRKSSRGSTAWFLPKSSPFAVLIKEQKFAAFRREIATRTDLTHVFLITDSEENFRSMTRRLPANLETVQLYKSYLENFRINTNLLGYHEV